MPERRTIRLEPNLIELGKSTLPAGLADESGAYPFYCSSPEPKAIGQWIADGEAVFLGTGGVASVNFGRGKFAYSTDCWAIQCRKGELTTEYLYRVLQHLLHRIDYVAFEGSGLRHLRKDFIRELTVEAPGDQTQARVTEILAVLDDAIEQTAALAMKAQQIKAGFMHDLFNCGVTSDGQLRPPREQAPQLYKESLLGWIPSEWQSETLRSCLRESPTNGIYKPAELIGHGNLLVGQAAITSDRCIELSLARRAVVNSDEIQRFGLAENDLLVSRVFATVEGVGQPALVPALHEPAVFESNMMRLRVDVAAVRPRILFEWLRGHRARRFIVGGVNASNQASINQQVLNPLPVPRPLPEEQERIEALIDAQDARYTSELAKLEKLIQIRAGVMDDLLTGRVRPPVVASESVAAVA